MQHYDQSSAVSSRPAGELTMLNNRLSEVKVNLENRLEQLTRLADMLTGQRPPQPVPDDNNLRGGGNAFGLVNQAHMGVNLLETLANQISEQITRMEGII